MPFFTEWARPHKGEHPAPTALPSEAPKFTLNLSKLNGEAEKENAPREHLRMSEDGLRRGSTSASGPAMSDGILYTPRGDVFSRLQDPKQYTGTMKHVAVPQPYDLQPTPYTLNPKTQKLKIQTSPVSRVREHAAVNTKPRTTWHLAS